MSEQSTSSSMRDVMPETARWVDARRAKWGAAHVNECVRRALAGEPGFFYAIEQGYTLGTPFPPTSDIADLQRLGVITGCTFAGFMARPKEGTNGSD